MEIRVDRNEFLKCISRTQTIIEKKSNMPILATVLLQAVGTQVTISATDLELSFQQSVPAEIVTEGSVTISGRKLFEILKESRSAEFHIKDKENNWVHLADGAARFDLACLPADEFPAVTQPEDVVMVPVESDLLAEMLGKTMYSLTVEDVGFKLSGVYTEKGAEDPGDLLRMVSTDGHRLSLVEKTFPGLEQLQLEKGVMIPKKGMMELNRLAAEGGPLELGFQPKQCVARKENVFLGIRLLETRFPDYRAVIPRESRITFEVGRLPLLEAMRKMLILSNERYRAVKITLGEDAMELVSTNPELGEARENIAIQHHGERLEAGFNPRYFIDALQSMVSEEVTLAFVDPSKPCIIRGKADEGFLGLIMPMRV